MEQKLEEKYTQLIEKHLQRMDEEEEQKIFLMRERTLRLMFTRLNREFFGGRLLRYKVRLAHFFSSGTLGKIDIFKRVILVSSSLVPSYYRRNYSTR